MAEPVLALEVLYEAVKTRFALEGPANVAQPFGWRNVAQLFTGPRIVWVPGNPIGAVGRVGPPRNPGGDPRSLGTLVEQFHVVIQDQDSTDPENEQLQYRKVRKLHDYWYRAVYLASFGTFTIESVEWLTKNLERRYGAALQVVGTIQAKLPDAAPSGSDYDFAPEGTGAELGVSELDVTETQTVEPDDL